jgi:mono/diheme cytochrome c family protein
MRKRRVHLITLLMLVSFAWLVSCSKETPQEQSQQQAAAAPEQAAPSEESTRPVEPPSTSEVDAPVAETTGSKVGGPTADAEEGKNVYAKKCATCHGKSGEGNAALAKSMKVEIRDLGSKEAQAKSDEELAQNLGEGIGKMKPVRGLSDADVRNVIAYVRSLAKK